eukprot:COSAG01_NODE_2904_length_6887_cov_2.857543_10_plen_141_part_00
MQHVVHACAVGRHPRAMEHLPAVSGQDEARHESDDRAMRAQRRQMGKPALRLPRVLLHKTTETPGLVAVVHMRLVAQIICAVAAIFCQAVAKRGRQEAGSTAETLTREYAVVRQEELLVFVGHAAAPPPAFFDESNWPSP